MKAWVSVFYYTFSTIVLDSSVALDGDARYVLNVEVLQSPAAVRHALNTRVSHQGAALHAQLFQIWTVARQELQAKIRDITFSYVQGA